MSWSERTTKKAAAAPLTDIPSHPLQFAREILNFQPDEHQAQIFSPGIQRGLLCCTRQFGKSTCVSTLALHTALTKPGSTSLVVAPQHTQSGEFLRKAIQYLPALNIRPRSDGIHRNSLLLPNGSRILALTNTEAAVRSYTADLVVIDEAARCNDLAIKAVRGALSTTNGAMWLMSTPKGRTGYFYKAWTSDANHWFRLRVTADECPRIGRSFLEEERLELGDTLYRQEYFCEFSAPTNAVFDGQVISLALIDDVPRPGVLYSTCHYYIGVDFGKLHDPTAIVILEVNDMAMTLLNYLTWDPKKMRERTIRHIERLPLHTTYPDVVSRLKTLVNMPQYKGRVTLVLDATGLGTPIADFLKSSGLDCKFENVIITPDRKRDLVTGLQMLFDLRGLRIPKDLPGLDPLLHELTSMQMHESRSGAVTKYEAPSGEHDDLAIALALACWPERPHVPTIGEKSDRLI